ncbi:MAG: DUF4434 domain-containing protein, partial [Eubacteriales bacterium]|nr:DUF4434 domain-containing protein [Eubacteriales bacterium]
MDTYRTRSDRKKLEQHEIADERIAVAVMKKRFISLFIILPLLTALMSTACGTNGKEESSVTEDYSANESLESSEDVSSDITDIYTGKADRSGLKTCVTLGCAYETSKAALSTYPDDGTMLTDAEFNTLCLDSEGFAGYTASGNALEITVDLGTIVDGLCDFEIYYLIKSGVSREPSSFAVSVSTDGVSYTEVGNAQCGGQTVYLLDRQYGETLELENSVKGRYIRFNLISKNGFSVLLQEVCAYKYLNDNIAYGTPQEGTEYKSAPESITVPHISYSFITALPFAGCTEEDADEYFDNLQNAGLEGLIVLNGAGYDGTIMSESAFDTMLARCEKRGMKVFMGLNMAEYDLYSTDGYADTFLSTAKTTAAAIYAKYKLKYPNALYGWYFNTELNNSVYSSHPEVCVKLLNGFIDIFNEIDPNMPMLMSPFTASWAGNADKLQSDLSSIMEQVNFRSFDIYCPQDSVGAELITIGSSASYLAAAKSCCDEKGIRFWANLENFIIKSNLPGCDDTVPAPLSRFIEQMEIASRYAEILTSFTFEAYSPEAFGNYTIYNDTGYYYDKYLEYLNTGEIAETKPDGLNISVRDAEEGYLYITVSLKTPSYGISDLAV